MQRLYSDVVQAQKEGTFDSSIWASTRWTLMSAFAVPHHGLWNNENIANNTVPDGKYTIPPHPPKKTAPAPLPKKQTHIILPYSAVVSFAFCQMLFEITKITVTDLPFLTERTFPTSSTSN